MNASITSFPWEEQHLRGVLREYVDYYNATRPHRTLALEPPREPRSVPRDGKVMSIPVLGGIHHRYERRAAGCDLVLWPHRGWIPALIGLFGARGELALRVLGSLALIYLAFLMIGEFMSQPWVPAEHIVSRDRSEAVDFVGYVLAEREGTLVVTERFDGSEAGSSRRSLRWRLAASTARSARHGGCRRSRSSWMSRRNHLGPLPKPGIATSNVCRPSSRSRKPGWDKT